MVHPARFSQSAGSVAKYIQYLTLVKVLVVAF